MKNILWKKFISEVLTKSFLFNLFHLSRFSHAKKYLIRSFLHNLNPYHEFVLSKDKQRSLCIWAIKQIKHRRKKFADDLYFWILKDEMWVANLDQIHGLYEYLDGSFQSFYNCSCADKVVLDIGGYIGDTARYFLKKSARKVIIYEPVEKNLICMRLNLNKYSESIEIIPKAITKKTGPLTILSNYPAGHIGFGNRPGKYELKVDGESFDSILSHLQADIAKVDCEGYEKYLLNVDNMLLRNIAYWMIEVHDEKIGNKLMKKFIESGFESIPISVPSGHQSILHFQLSKL